MDVGTTTDTGGWKLGDGSVVTEVLFDVAPIVCGDCLFCPCFVMHYLHVVSFLVMHSSLRGRESWLLDFNCLPGVL